MNEELFPEPLRPYAALIVGIATALAIFVVGWIVSKWAHRFVLGRLRKMSLEEALARFLASMAQYAVLAMALVAALGKVGVQTTSLVALLGAAGLAVGLALQGNLSNFAAGLMVLFFRPFVIGDKITANDKHGTVHDIGLFATTLLTTSNEKIILPNNSVTENAITNFSSQGTLRGAIAVGVAYGTDVEAAMRVMVEACAAVPSVLEDPSPSVNFSGFGASSLDFEVRPWSTAGDFLGMLHDVRISLYNGLNAAGVEIPFDQIVVHKAD